MNWTRARSRLSAIPLGIAALALMLCAGVLGFSTRSAAAQNADTDADSYADDLERQLGSSPTDPDSTPENFALLWTCTDGNDNDRDGKRDFFDPGCRNTVPGASPTPAPTQAPGGSGGGSGGGAGAGGTGAGSTGGGSGGGSTGSGGSGSSHGGGSSDENAVLGGTNAPIGGPADVSGSGAASDTATGAGQDSGIAADAAAIDTTSTDAGGAADEENASSEGSGDDGGFPWLISLLILLIGFAAGAVCWALLGRSKARSRATATTARY